MTTQKGGKTIAGNDVFQYSARLAGLSSRAYSKVYARLTDVPAMIQCPYMTPTPTDKEIRRFRDTVYRFYCEHGRHGLPWRHTPRPYRILVSEIMLQQTQVPRVIEKYRQFMRAFPGVHALAKAPLTDVLAVWQGMGYNRRALMLKRLAEAVMKEYGGRIPRDAEALAALPGIGEYTKNAVLAFAYNRPVVFIETNIRSVFIHHFFPGQATVSDDDILPLIERSLDRKNPRQWYSALMDYGAWIKKAYGNPSRKSSSYKRQSAFEGSVRQVRGMIVRTLSAKKRCSLASLQKACACEPIRFEKALAGLRKDGLVIIENGAVRIS